MVFKIAKETDLDEIIQFYDAVIDAVNRTSVKLGWQKGVYPAVDFIKPALERGEVLIERENARIIACAVVNHTVNEEYNWQAWKYKEPADRLSTIHALAVAPEYWGKKVSEQFLQDILAYCKKQGDIANHLDVIDTNVPAFKLYMRAGYKEISEVEMYYEVVGTRWFWMMEYIF